MKVIIAKNGKTILSTRMDPIFGLFYADPQCLHDENLFDCLEKIARLALRDKNRVTSMFTYYQGDEYKIRLFIANANKNIKEEEK